MHVSTRPVIIWAPLPGWWGGRAGRWWRWRRGRGGRTTQQRESEAGLVGCMSHGNHNQIQMQAVMSSQAAVRTRASTQMDDCQAGATCLGGGGEGGLGLGGGGEGGEGEGGGLRGSRSTSKSASCRRWCAVQYSASMIVKQASAKCQLHVMLHVSLGQLLLSAQCNKQPQVHAGTAQWVVVRSNHLAWEGAGREALGWGVGAREGRAREGRERGEGCGAVRW
jgi:hypothetical protein